MKYSEFVKELKGLLKVKFNILKNVVPCEKELAGLYKHKLETMKLKNKDYANNNDVFNNFTETGKYSNLPEEKVVIVQLGNKLSRISNLIDGKKPNFESILDSILDLSCYADLFYLYEKEKENKKNIKKRRWNVKKIRMVKGRRRGIKRIVS